MKIEIRFRGLEPSVPLREHARRQIQARLGRFGRELSAVVVRIGDVNGPKGGVDKRCRIEAHGPRLGSPALEKSSGDPYSAVELAVERLSAVVRRNLGRLQRARKRVVAPLGSAS